MDSTDDISSELCETEKNNSTVVNLVPGSPVKLTYDVYHIVLELFRISARERYGQCFEVQLKYHLQAVQRISTKRMEHYCAVVDKHVYGTAGGISDCLGCLLYMQTRLP